LATALVSLLNTFFTLCIAGVTVFQICLLCFFLIRNFIFKKHLLFLSFQTWLKVAICLH
jgi:hypothetical protein